MKSSIDIHYDDGEPVEMGDIVEVDDVPYMDGFEAEVVQIGHRKRRLRVRCDDGSSEWVDLAACSLLRRQA